jgi:serine/threonine protein kinase/tetratricopeptide (TPR) repeat protein
VAVDDDGQCGEDPAVAMTDAGERHQRLRAIFEAALEYDPSAREGYLDRSCAGDAELRDQVVRLLLARAAVSSFLEQSPGAHDPEVRAEDDVAVTGSHRDVVERDFRGTERFRVLRRLGVGGMGVVYEVHDGARDEIVALKTLLRANAADIYRLKREFRSLADVAHVNLVSLYELVVEEDHCFFTMELVNGVNFVDYVRGASIPQGSPSSSTPSDWCAGRLRSAFRQLVAGISELHRLGKLHRDIKPSNVLVTPEGRVVVLDFGLIAELLPQDAGDASYVSGGTPAYMSPEEASGAMPSEAGDWYGIGVTLYETLTGTIPFVGPVRDVLFRKRTCEPPAPAEVVPDVPADLSAICMGLLCRNPERRLSGPAALRELARDSAAPVSDATSAGSAIRDASFVGRDLQCQALNVAFDAVKNGAAKAVSVHGPSGIGKSALVRRFLSQFRMRADVVVLSGRCYENESVPYKALDGVIDDLSRYLLSIPGEEVENLMPPDGPALTRVFPVMLQVDAVAKRAMESRPESVDPLGLRRRAFGALRELLGRLADRRSLVIWIDDLQWADADSVVLLEELLRPTKSTAMLTLLCFRSEETAAKPFLQALLESGGREMWSAISLEPMTDDEAYTLIGVLLPPNSTLTNQDKRRMTREAGGSPFILEQLARHVDLNRMELGRGPTFAEMFATRLGALSLDARRFLETLAICGRPMAPGIICDACGVVRDRQSLVGMLRSSHLIRSSGSSERIETYHDRIREVVAAQIAPDAVRRIHRLMGQALVDRRSDDCEALFEHYRGAEDLENASIQAGLAAAKAGTALAFDRAVFFYRQALTLTPTSAAAHAWREGLAKAIANAGRPAEAAEAYLHAAREAGPSQRVELQRRGAEQFLIGGHIDSGLDLIRTMLADLGVGVPRSPRTALLWLLWRRARLRWRGLRFVARPVDEIDANTLLRIDSCWSATTGLAPVDMITAADFSVRHLLVALDAGDPYRIARAMAMESVARALYPSDRRLSERLVQQSKALAKSVGNPHAIALCILADAVTAMMLGRWKTASTLSEQALAMFRDQCVGFTWELNIAQNLLIWTLMYQGQLGELSRLVPGLLANARSSGNLYIATELVTRSNFVWLAADDPDEGEREMVASIERWSQKGFHRQHYSARLARVQTALYRGNAEAAWRLLAEKESLLRRSMLTRVQIIRVESLYLRARCALAMAAENRNSRRFLSVARANARRIARERMPWSDPLALLLKAGIASLESDTVLALRHLHAAADGFDRANMQLYAAVARRRVGAVQEDDHGREAQRHADEWMAAQNIKNPPAMTRMLVPGFPDVR